jgi:hypothetical protein
MKFLRLFSSTVLPVALAALACDGQQYVSPDTVALVVTNETTGAVRVNRCHYIPILLGSEVEARYQVEDEVAATIRVTRDEVTVNFQDPQRSHDVFAVPADNFESSHEETASDSPDGYSTVLTSPCTPDSATP